MLVVANMQTLKIIASVFAVVCVVKCQSDSQKFKLRYQWTHLNFTWPDKETYNKAITTKAYIPENVVPAGIKYYNNKFYLAIPRIRDGNPVTMASFQTIERDDTIKSDIIDNIKNTKQHNEDNTITNMLVNAYPSWKMNEINNCNAIQSSHSMEIDSSGVMWVLDGNRFNSVTKCPPKIVLLDLNDNGKVVHTYTVPNSISNSKGGFLNDIVIDESTDDTFAYITENSADFGLIIYSKKLNKAWKVTDDTMKANLSRSTFAVDGVVSDKPVPIDGIALEPRTSDSIKRYVYYTALTGIGLYRINNQVLQNETKCLNGEWKQYIEKVGEKPGNSDGMVMDTDKNLYMGIMDQYAIAKYDSKANKMSIIDKDEKTFVWPDSFAMDNAGYLYVLNNGIHKFFNPTIALSVGDKIKFTVMGLFTGTKSYLYN